MAQVTELEQREAALFAGAYTIRESAALLRATTPPPDVNLWRWKRRRDTFIRANADHVAQWIRRGMGWDAPVRVSAEVEKLQKAAGPLYFKLSLAGQRPRLELLKDDVIGSRRSMRARRGR